MSSTSPGAVGSRLSAAEDLVDRAINGLAGGTHAIEEVCAVAQAAAAVVEARVAYDRRHLGADPRARLFVNSQTAY